MADTSSEALKASRIRAYIYIVNSIEAMGNWEPPINSDSKLANYLQVPVSEIISLREGKSNPSKTIVARFKLLIGPLEQEEVINSYLVTPFHTKI